MTIFEEANRIWDLTIKSFKATRFVWIILLIFIGLRSLMLLDFITSNLHCAIASFLDSTLASVCWAIFGSGIFAVSLKAIQFSNVFAEEIKNVVENSLNPVITSLKGDTQGALSVISDDINKVVDEIRLTSIEEIMSKNFPNIKKEVYGHFINSYLNLAKCEIHNIESNYRFEITLNENILKILVNLRVECYSSEENGQMSPKYRMVFKNIPGFSEEVFGFGAFEYRDRKSHIFKVADPTTDKEHNEVDDTVSYSVSYNIQGSNDYYIRYQYWAYQDITQDNFFEIRFKYPVLRSQVEVKNITPDTLDTHIVFLGKNIYLRDSHSMQSDNIYRLMDGVVALPGNGFGVIFRKKT